MMSGVVDEHRVHLVHNGEMVFPLHQVLRLDGHVVPQVVETELVVRTEGNVGHVGLAARGGVGLMVVDAVHRKTVELVHRSHPLRVAAGQVVVHRHHMHALSGQGIEEYRKRGHQRLTLAGRHLGDAPLVEHDAAEKLYVVMHHVPGDGIASGLPTVGVDGLVALDGDEILACGQVAVELRGGYLHGGILRETVGGSLHDGESLGKYLVELPFDLLVDLLGEPVNLARMALLLLQGGFRLLEYPLQLGDALLVGTYRLRDIATQGRAAGTQVVVRQGVYLRVERENPVHIGLDLLAVLVALGPEKCLDYFR